ncbi:hypothetical protein ACLBW0_24630 [Enterobacteriaceae bacterium C34A]
MDFENNEGLRAVGRERMMVAEDLSETIHNRHLTSHAVDVEACPDGKASWAMPLYAYIAGAVRQAASLSQTCWSIISPRR